MKEQLERIPENELRWRINISGRLSFTLVISLVVSLTFIWSGQLKVCTTILGGTIFCGQVGSDNEPKNEIQSTIIAPTTIPATVIGLTSTPPISIVPLSRGICEISTLVSTETDKIRITVTSIVVEQINVDLSHLLIDLVVENLTNTSLTLKLDGNIGIFESGKSEIVAAPELEMSSFPITLPAKENQAAKISVDRIWDQIPLIDIEFRHMILNGSPIDEGISVIGIPVSCIS